MARQITRFSRRETAGGARWSSRRGATAGSCGSTERSRFDAKTSIVAVQTARQRRGRGVGDPGGIHLYGEWARGTPAVPTRRRAETSVSDLHTLMIRLAVGKSPSWHAGWLWFSNRGAHEIITVDVEATSQAMARVPTSTPCSIDWSPDGRLLIVPGPERACCATIHDRQRTRDANARWISYTVTPILISNRPQFRRVFFSSCIVGRRW